LAGRSWKGFAMKRASKTEKQERKADAIKALRKMLRPGKSVFTIVTSVNRMGTYRHIKLAVVFRGELHNISGYVSDLLGWHWHDDGSLGVTGAGMDMGFHAVYALSRALYPKGFRCIGEGCPSNDHDHSNGDWGHTPHKHADGGYALVQRWV